MKFIICLSLLFLMACQPGSQPDILYQSEAFTLHKNKVVQGNNIAEVISPTQIKSNYQSPASQTFSNRIAFKFSINEKDNEMAPGNDHIVLINGEKASPVMTFGQLEKNQPAADGKYLPVNYDFTFRVDMSPVLKQFEEQGFYEAYDGTRVAKADFKGFYIAGAAAPLSWDFVNLDNKGLKLGDEDGDGIYEITVKLNPYDASEQEAKEWNLSKDLSNRPQYTSDQPIVDALFNLSLEEAILAIEPDSTFRTGAKWGGVWTRDISYSIFLAFAYHEPEVARISLMKKVKRGRIIQDTGSGGAWPVSSDRMTWAVAAWELYKATGDQDWLRQAFEIIRNSAEDDFHVIRDEATGMYKGESSFLDWREQTYPKWMSNVDIYNSENLGTNAVHYQAHIILGEMAKLLGEPHENYLQRAEAIKKGMNEHLWMADQGYYGNFLYGKNYPNLSPRFEALGEALAILFEVADKGKANTIIAQSPLTPFGTTCIYPQIPDIPPYHNNGIWPFVQAYWNLAAAKAGNEDVLNHGLASIYRAGGLFLTNYENFVAETGDFKGTEINSHRMLWSMAGNLAMVHRVFMGMSFEPDGMTFNPVIPKVYGGTKTLSHFKYRDATLSITVRGHGNQIKSIKMDGKTLQNAFLSAETTGSHTLEIVMANNDFGGPLNKVPNRFSLRNPQLIQVGTGASFTWDPIEGAEAYLLYKDGEVIARMTDTSFGAPGMILAEYKISAWNKEIGESFTSEPILVHPDYLTFPFEAENFASKSTLPYTDFSGEGFVEISNEKNRNLEFVFEVETEGDYLIDFRYSNGSGPWNTDNKCALRTLYVNKENVGAVVFPQRGTDEWSDWGWTNSYKITLRKGGNRISLDFKDWNINMNVEVNKAMIDQMRLVKL